jgi:hypothetical protein
LQCGDEGRNAEKVWGHGSAQIDTGSIMLVKSDHFDIQWRTKVGTRAPTDGEVRRLIGGSVRIQKFNVLYTLRGMPVKILALYYHRQRDVFFKVDELTGKVVTVVPGWRVKDEVQRV